MTIRTFEYANKYNLSDAPNRQIRRLMEKDNEKLRKLARKKYIDTVRQLAAFAKKRDPRVKQRHEERALELEAEKKSKALREAQAKRERGEAQQARVRQAAEERDERLEAEYARMEAEMDSMYLGSGKKKKSNEINELYCVACRKTFRSEKQLEVHEGSKKHRELVALLQDQMLREEMMHERADEDDVRNHLHSLANAIVCPMALLLSATAVHDGSSIAVASFANVFSVFSSLGVFVCHAALTTTARFADRSNSSCSDERLGLNGPHHCNGTQSECASAATHSAMLCCSQQPHAAEHAMRLWSNTSVAFCRQATRAPRTPPMTTQVAMTTRTAWQRLHTRWVSAAHTTNRRRRPTRIRRRMC